MSDPSALSDEKLGEIEAGLEGVTPGPWKVYDGCSWRRIGNVGARYDDCAVLAPCIASDGHPDLTSRSGDREANLAHIARCDPDTIRQLIAEVRASRLHAAEAGWRVKPLEWTGSPGSNSPDHVIWTAHTIFGRYQAWSSGRAAVWTFSGERNRVASVEAAKAAAQSHYAASISSAILPGGEGKSNSPEIPDGWKLAPVEPTGDMWLAGRKAFETEAERFRAAHRYETASAIADRAPETIYAAMLSAAPSHHAVGEE